MGANLEGRAEGLQSMEDTGSGLLRSKNVAIL